MFAVESIPAGTNLGISHIHDPRAEDAYIRTPLGGFYNHSEKPNCVASKQDSDLWGRVVCLIALKDIKAGEEVTAFYWLYEISKED